MMDTRISSRLFMLVFCRILIQVSRTVGNHSKTFNKLLFLKHLQRAKSGVYLEFPVITDKWKKYIWTYCDWFRYARCFHEKSNEGNYNFFYLIIHLFIHLVIYSCIFIYKISRDPIYLSPTATSDSGGPLTWPRNVY